MGPGGLCARIKLKILEWRWRHHKALGKHYVFEGLRMKSAAEVQLSIAGRLYARWREQRGDLDLPTRVTIRPANDCRGGQ